MMRDCFGGFCFLKTDDFLIIAYLRRMGNKKTASLRMKAHSFLFKETKCEESSISLRKAMDREPHLFFLLIYYFNVPMISAQALQAGQSQKRAPFSLMSFA